VWGAITLGCEFCEGSSSLLLCGANGSGADTIRFNTGRRAFTEEHLAWVLWEVVLWCTFGDCSSGRHAYSHLLVLSAFLHSLARDMEGWVVTPSSNHGMASVLETPPTMFGSHTNSCDVIVIVIAALTRILLPRQGSIFIVCLALPCFLPNGWMCYRTLHTLRIPDQSWRFAFLTLCSSRVVCDCAAGRD